MQWFFRKFLTVKLTWNISRDEIIKEEKDFFHSTFSMKSRKFDLTAVGWGGRRRNKKIKKMCTSKSWNWEMKHMEEVSNLYMYVYKNIPLPPFDWMQWNQFLLQIYRQTTTLKHKEGWERLLMSVFFSQDFFEVFQKKFLFKISIPINFLLIINVHIILEINVVFI